MINENQEHWLEKVNQNLDNLLYKAKKDNEIQRRMAKYYCRRNQIARSKLKKMKSKPETQNIQEEKRKFDILAMASFHA